MTTLITLDPVSRIEGHLRIDLEVEAGVVRSARSSGTSFRGFEPILVGRDPRDAPQLTQRICGVCPVPQSRAAVMAFEMAAGIQTNAQARLIRNLIESANFVDSHLLHFYLLVLPDFVSGLPTAGAWSANSPPRIWGGRAGLDPSALSDHVKTCLQIRRDCHAMGALLGGKMPHPVGIVPGGATASITAEAKLSLAQLASGVRTFVTEVYRADVEALVLAFPEYLDIGASGAGFLSFGGYPEADGSLLLASGVVNAAAARERLDPAAITESVAHSHYKSELPRRPSLGATLPDLSRGDAYSWLKAPRIGGRVFEVGPLARSVVAGVAPKARGIHARHLARVAEACLLVSRWADWVNGLEVGISACPAFPRVPDAGVGVGLVEAPRGALGHWVTIANSVIQQYQVISPTTWNGSPRDEQDQPGPLEKALEGVKLADSQDPIEVNRVIHSFDPCLQCSVH